MTHIVREKLQVIFHNLHTTIAFLVGDFFFFMTKAKILDSYKEDVIEVLRSIMISFLYY